MIHMLKQVDRDLLLLTLPESRHANSEAAQRTRQLDLAAGALPIRFRADTRKWHQGTDAGQDPDRSFGIVAEEASRLADRIRNLPVRERSAAILKNFGDGCDRRRTEAGASRMHLHPRSFQICVLQGSV